MMTLQYTQLASSRIQQYLDAVRDRLVACRSVDVQEVVDELRGHIERELAGAPQPVSDEDATRVLDRLGPPEQVVGEEDMAWWRKVVLRLQKGPEDWRLAYLSFGVLVLGAFTGPVGLLASFVLSRAALAVAKGPEPAGRKWLIYPSLIIVYAIAAGFGLLWPAFAVGTLVSELLFRTPQMLLYKAPFFDHDGLGTMAATAASATVALAIWWSFLWAVARVQPRLVRVAFRPFADQWTGRWSGWLVLGTLAIGITMVASTALWWNVA